MSEQRVPKNRKRGVRERLGEWRQRFRGHRSTSPLPSGTSTHQTMESLPSSYQTNDSVQHAPSPAMDVATVETPSLPGASRTDNAEEPRTDEDPSATPQPDPTPSRMDKGKDVLHVTSSLLQLVLKKVPDAIDSNPVKIFFSIAKSVLELKEVCYAMVIEESLSEIRPKGHG
ncbi:hypothetical protein BKA70DRAFT_1399974 [Coprinopsis sp. MPI-PUGE-AT-0042]|nr:hypothetical protein BKA70DRAFT_1399974 [Coprinopsis sp. MPI-PUGE-AT-0042]